MKQRLIDWYRKGPQADSLARISAVLAVTLASASLAGLFGADTNTKFGDTMGFERFQSAADRAQITSLQLKLNELQAQMRQRKPATIEPLTTTEALQLSNRMDAIEARQRRIEVTITNNPARSLELPLMRRDIDNLRDNTAKLVDNLEQGIDRTYDLSKWLLGGLAVSVIGLGLSSFFASRSRRD